jgi:hypothetical protein
MTKRLIMAFVLFTLCFCGALQPVYSATDTILPLCSGSTAGSSAVCSSDPTTNPLTGNNGVILKAANIVAFLGGVAAVILIIIGGFRYITSNGDAGSVSSAKSTIINSLIGLVIIALARSILGFVISKLN